VIVVFGDSTIIGEFARFGCTCFPHSQYVTHGRQHVQCYRR